ncbi:MAG TPA: hypothetical protein VMV60_07160 [Thermoanaerobaculia bacterium]|nr:hypothetical protein [Thermoanaerobaculia bacterium]
MRIRRLSFLARSLLTLCVLALPVPARADDAGLAARLVGKWDGQWQNAFCKGGLTIRITAAKGNTLDGETIWLGTIVGDVSDRFSGATLKFRVLKATGNTMDLVVKVSEDGTSLEGWWFNHAGAYGGLRANGPIKLKKLE